MFEGIVITIATAATPLLIAAVGELVVERSGVLNLGVEGMMVMGAVTGFAVALTTGSPWLGVLAAIIVGALFSLLFGFLTLTLVTNQVATGLALTLLGLGFSGMIGESFVGQPGIKLETISHLDYIGPLFGWLAQIPYVGRILFDQDPVFYLAILLTFGVAWFLFRTRAGLTLALRRRQPRLGARAWHQRHRHPLSCGDVRRRLRGSGRRLPVARLHPAMDREHDRRARLDRVGAGGLRLLAALAGSRRRISLRRGLDRPAPCSSAGDRHTLPAAFFAPLSGNHRRPRSNLKEQAIDDDQHTGLTGAAVRARSLETTRWDETSKKRTSRG